MGDEFTLPKPWEPKPLYKSILHPEPQFKSAFGDQFQLKLDPEIQAQMSFLQWRLQIDQIRSSWMSPNWMQLDRLLLAQMTTPPLLPKPSALGRPPAPLPPPPCLTFPRGKGPDEPKSGEARDVLKAVWELPVVKCTLDMVTHELEHNVWDKLNTGEKVLLIGHGGLIVGGAVAGIISDQPARAWVFDKLSDTDIPIPKVDGVSFKFYAKDGALTGGSLTMPWLPGTSVTTGMKPYELPDKSTIPDYHFHIKVDVLKAIPQLQAIF